MPSLEPPKITSLHTTLVSDWASYLWVLLLSLKGGLVEYLDRQAEAMNTQFETLLGALLDSVFAGLITFWLCQHFEVPPHATLASVAVGAYMGSRLTRLLERAVARKISKI